MITSIHGTLASVSPLKAVVELNGFGYEVNIPITTAERLPPAGAQTKLHTVVIYREDSQMLYGFTTTAERDFFRLLIENVTGVGPKVGRRDPGGRRRHPRQMSGHRAENRRTFGGGTEGAGRKRGRRGGGAESDRRCFRRRRRLASRRSGRARCPRLQSRRGRPSRAPRQPVVGKGCDDRSPDKESPQLRAGQRRWPAHPRP
jgi:RuvA N terminal domain